MFNLIKTCSKLFQCVQKFIQNANVCPNDLVALTNIVQKKDKAEFYSFSLSLTMVLQIKLLSAFFAFTTTIYYQYNIQQILDTCTYFYFQIVQGLSIKAISEKGHRSCRYYLSIECLLVFQFAEKGRQNKLVFEKKRRL